MTVIAHLTSSRLYGGPERQILGLSAALPADYQSVLMSFWEGGLCADFLREARLRGLDAVALHHDTPRLRAAAQELRALLEHWKADVLLTHGYKADLLGLRVARTMGLPIVAVSRGWTSESFRVRLYEWLDRKALARMDHVVCVSEGQRTKVLRGGVAAAQTSVIHNAVHVDTPQGDDTYSAALRELVPPGAGPIVGSSGRLSPEKGFGVLVQAAQQVLARFPNAAFVHFGDGVLRESLEKQRDALGLSGRFVFAGFRWDARRYLQHVDVVTLPSFTEGLPNVALEACAAGKAIVATRVGGTPEIVRDGENGCLVPAGDPDALAQMIGSLLADATRRELLGARGRDLVERAFTFAGQSRAYQQLLAGLVGESQRSRRAA